MLSLILHFPWWSVLNKKPKMVDLQFNWEAVWPETSLFGDEPINISYDSLTSSKSSSKEDRAVLDLPGNFICFFMKSLHGLFYETFFA